MKIVHTESGEAYHLNPGTQLEIERPNLFFGEWGEQSLPVDLPDTPLNRRLAGYPDQLAGAVKPRADIACSIMDGDYYAPARQAVLGSRRGKGITATFYMNEGSFLSRIKDVSLAEVFGNDTVPDVATVSQGISFCQSLMDGSNPDFAIFPILVDLDGERRFVNRMERMDASGDISASGAYGLYNAFERKETVDDRTVTLSPGYYISPFVRASFVLRKVFAYFGYELQDSFLTTSEPFASMVLVNSTIDSLVNGTILLQQLVPDCTCSTLLDVFRKKFCCEFIPDEVEGKVSILLFKDVMEAQASIDLTPYLVGYPEISYQEGRQLKLSSEHVISEGTQFGSVSELGAKCPEAYYEPADGGYYREGFSLYQIHECLSDGNLPYHAEGGLKDYEVTVPDLQFTFSTLQGRQMSNAVSPGRGARRRYTSYSEETTTGLFPYIGDGRTLNSSIVFSETDDSGDSEVEVSTDAPKLEPILAFTYSDGLIPRGTNHDPNDDWGYSLLYNGPKGIFEKFWRDYDNLLRNSLHHVSADLLLPSSAKCTMPVHAKILIHGTELLFDTFKYTLGGSSEPLESTLLTAGLDSACDIAVPESSRLPKNTSYKWSVVRNAVQITQSQYQAAGYPYNEDVLQKAIDEGRLDHVPDTIYPPAPTEAQYQAGGSYYSRSAYRLYADRQRQPVFERIDISLVPVLYGD